MEDKSKISLICYFRSYWKNTSVIGIGGSNFLLFFFFSEITCFSKANRSCSLFLLQMDNEGYLPVSLIANFHRVKALTENMELIIDVSINNLKEESLDGSHNWV